MHNLNSPGALSQYGEAANVPLIKSPSLRVPKVVQMPPDIHPLPESVSAYFAYPFTLEPHLLALESTRQQTLAAHAVQRSQYLAARAAEQERRRTDLERIKYEVEERRRREERERVWKVAPGFDSQMGTLVPKKVGQPEAVNPTSLTVGPIAGTSNSAAAQEDRMMADLVEQLARLDAAHSHKP